MTDKIVILTTCETQDEARKLARALVEERVAACVNIVSQVESVYRWKGQVESAAEFLLVIKSSRDMFGQVCSVLERVHSYELPECIALPIVDGSERYLEWLDGGLKHDEGGPR